MEKDPLVISNKSCKAYFLIEGAKVYFSGDFDSGNLEKVEQLSPYVVSNTPSSTESHPASTRHVSPHAKPSSTSKPMDSSTAQSNLLSAASTCSSSSFEMSLFLKLER